MIHPYRSPVTKIIVSSNYGKETSSSISIDNAKRVANADVSTFAIFLNRDECEAIIAVWEKQGILGSVVDRIRSAYNAKRS